MPNDDLTRIDPQIAQLAEYYRSPAEQRPGEGLATRLLRIAGAALSSSKEDFDRAQMAKERLFASNVELNRLKEEQKNARMRLDLDTKEAESRLKTAAQNRQVAKEAADRFNEVYALMTQMERKATAGQVPEWSTEAGQEELAASTDVKRAYADYLRRGKGQGGTTSEGLEESRLLDILSKLQTGARTATKGREDMLEETYKEVTSKENLTPYESVGRYAVASTEAMNQLAVDSQMVDLMGRPTPSTVQSGKIPQHYAQSLGAVRTAADNMQIDVPFWRDKSLSTVLRARLAEIKSLVGPQRPEDLDATYSMLIRDLVSTLAGPNWEQFSRGAGGIENAAALIQEAFRPELESE